MGTATIVEQTRCRMECGEPEPQLNGNSSQASLHSINGEQCVPRPLWWLPNAAQHKPPPTSGSAGGGCHTSPGLCYCTRQGIRTPRRTGGVVSCWYAGLGPC